jgi:alkanesulfonate monooxygenase SsuD/methylene tetrahydromethanopterin reductase-like flavin-dependent oxidoreductase (luciferase family)
MLARSGYAAEVAAIQAGWREGQPAAVAAVSDAMLDDTAIVGTPTEIRTQLAEWGARGLDEALLNLPPGSPDEAAPQLAALMGQ